MSGINVRRVILGGLVAGLGTILWLAFAIAVLILTAIGLHTTQSYLKSSGLYLVSALVSSLVGAALYKE